MPSPRAKGWLYLAVLLPLWSSYIVRVYAWKLILAREGIVAWLANQIGACVAAGGRAGDAGHRRSVALGLVAGHVHRLYLCLAALHGAADPGVAGEGAKSYLEASADLGAQPGETFRNVILPLSFPGVVAGSIFTFSLTLGDFIVPQVLGNSAFFIGQAVLAYQGTAGNLPLAAAMTVVPMVIMIIYLLVARNGWARSRHCKAESHGAAE